MLATFGQLTDTHVRDAESPARAPFLDRLGPPFTSTFRPQEAFSTQTLDATIISNALPTMARSLHEDPLTLNLAITSYLLASAAALPSRP